MLKRLIFGLALMLHLSAIAHISTAEVPWPDCYPCPTEE